MTKSISELRQSRSYFGGFSMGGSNAVMFSSYALLFWFGSTLILSGDITFVDLMTAMLALMLGALGLGQAMNDLTDTQEGLEATKRIYTVVDESRASPIDGLSLEGVKPTEKARGRIELKDVTFAYPTRPDIDVCSGYNLTVEPGELVALVGASGSGKSTIMSLLLRFYDPREGQVLLDGVDIKSLNVRWLRSQIGYVGQEPVLFQGTIAENICYGIDFEVATVGSVKVLSEEHADKKHITPHLLDRIQAACKLANAHEFIVEFPKGYDTDVGPGGAALSGGQKQRIAIARALVRRPAVLLLDEATSALDSASERLVQASIDQLQQSKMQTTIVIAHRSVGWSGGWLVA